MQLDRFQRLLSLTVLGAVASAGCLDTMPPGNDVVLVDNDAHHSSHDDDTIIEEDEKLTICYQGTRMGVEVLPDGALLVQGDIVVGSEDQWCEGERARAQGDLWRWPNGVVPYRFGLYQENIFSAPVGLTTMERNTINVQLTQLDDLVAGLHIRPAVAADTHVIEFRPDPNRPGASSPVGRQPFGTNIVRIGPDFVSPENFVLLAHEIMHSLGLRHEQSRTDRDSFVTVNWNNISGCPEWASSSADCGPIHCFTDLAGCGCTQDNVDNNACYFSSNFVKHTATARIGSYNASSIMHYASALFAKPGRQSMTPVNPATSIFPGTAATLTRGDIETLDAMYPTLELLDVVFVSPRIPAKICELRGREHDDATQFSLSGTAYTFSANSVTYPVDIGISREGKICFAKSDFWGGTYSYPNDETSHYIFGAESFAKAAPIVLVSASLIPVLF